MPDDGIAPVRDLIASARRSLAVKMFTFDEPDLVAAVLAAHDRGVATTVLLNPAKFNGLRMNDATFAALEAGGVAVGWTNPAFAVTHEKSMVVDAAVVLIGTFNFSPKYFTRTRDYGLVVDDGGVAADVLACFDADRGRVPFEGANGCGPLAWGGGNARRLVAELIDGAKRQLLIQHPKFNDWAILDRVTAAAARGVKVHLLCGGHHGIEDWDLGPTLASQRVLARAGVQLRKQRHLRCHAKLIVGDGERALVGSMNIDASAFDQRRELGLLFDDPGAVRQLRKQFERDWQVAKHYRPEDPLRPNLAKRLAAKPPDPCGNDPAVTHD